MSRKIKKKLRIIKTSYWITLLVGITFSWFVWKTWDKINTLLGEGNLPYLIAGGIILIAILFGIGRYSFKKLAESFTN